MQRQNHARYNPRSKAHQLELFVDPVVRSALPTPDWRTLPSQTRHAVTALMARLILEHIDGDRQTAPEEARHDR